MAGCQEQTDSKCELLYALRVKQGEPHGTAQQHSSQANWRLPALQGRRPPAIMPQDVCVCLQECQHLLHWTLSLALRSRRFLCQRWFALPRPCASIFNQQHIAACLIFSGALKLAKLLKQHFATANCYSLTDSQTKRSGLSMFD